MTEHAAGAARPWRTAVLAILYGTALSLVGLLAYRGAPYYATPLALRPHHPAFWKLKPGGTLGHPLGTAGSALMVLMLLYSARKRLRALSRLGRLASWLDFHIFCGVVGPLLVVLHSSFKVHGLVALSFWSMVAVAASGFLGRYLYAQIPHRQSGDAMSAQEVQARQTELVARLRDHHHLPAAELATIGRLSEPGRASRSLPALLVAMPLAEAALRWRLRGFRRRYRHLPLELYRDLGDTMLQHALLRRRLLLWERTHRLFDYWHVLHKPFAAVMYLFLVLHVAVSLATGYGWMP